MNSERTLCFPRVPLEIPEDIAQCARDVFCIALVRFVVTWAVSALLDSALLDVLCGALVLGARSGRAAGLEGTLLMLATVAAGICAVKNGLFLVVLLCAGEAPLAV